MIAAVKEAEMYFKNIESKFKVKMQYAKKNTKVLEHTIQQHIDETFVKNAPGKWQRDGSDAGPAPKRRAVYSSSSDSEN